MSLFSYGYVNRKIDIKYIKLLKKMIFAKIKKHKNFVLGVYNG